MTTKELDSIKIKSVESLAVLMDEMSTDIKEASDAALEQAEHDGKETAKLTLSHSISIDLVNHKMEDSLAVSVRHKGTVENRLPDPNQPELFGKEEGGE